MRHKCVFIGKRKSFVFVSLNFFLFLFSRAFILISLIASTYAIKVSVFICSFTLNISHAKMFFFFQSWQSSFEFLIWWRSPRVNRIDKVSHVNTIELHLLPAAFINHSWNQNQSMNIVDFALFRSSTTTDSNDNSIVAFSTLFELSKRLHNLLWFSIVDSIQFHIDIIPGNWLDHYPLFVWPSFLVLSMEISNDEFSVTSLLRLLFSCSVAAFYVTLDIQSLSFRFDQAKQKKNKRKSSTANRIILSILNDSLATLFGGQASARIVCVSRARSDAIALSTLKVSAQALTVDVVPVNKAEKFPTSIFASGQTTELTIWFNLMHGQIHKSEHNLGR